MAKNDPQERSAANGGLSIAVGTHIDEISPRDWKLKHMDPRAIEAARLAARKNGLRLGAWVARAISSAAAKELAGSSTASVTQLPHVDAQGLYEKLMSIEEQIERDRQENASRIDSLQNDVRVIAHGLIPRLQERAG
jgi:hypothetical protein